MFSAGQYSTAGAKEQNDDACGMRLPEDETLHSKGAVAIIADGVSSAEGGREAAEACVQGYLSDYYSTPDSWTVKTATHRILGALNRWLYGTSQRAYRSDRALVTTLSVVVLKGGSAYLFHVGDTRIYRYRAGEIECLTRDHTVSLGHQKTALARAMGADTNVDIDYRTVPIEPNDIFILTTDGVHQWLSDAMLAEQVEENIDDPESVARNIVQLAQSRGSDDNLTCQMLRIISVPKLDEETFYRKLTQLPFPPPLEPGMILDSYRIVRELHSSKKTQIYLAVQTDTGAQVAIKTPSVNFEDDPRYIDRFLQEEWIGKRINNVHVAKICSSTQKRSFLYYATEFIDGQTLRAWMNDHPRAPLTAVRPLIEQLAAGLRAFHRLEMVHQDIKPENVLIDRDNTVKIVDFGSTKIAGLEENVRVLDESVPLATVDYAAPELFLGHGAGNRTDGFALGAIAYEMLTGQLPYGGPLSAKTAKTANYVSARIHDEKIPVWVDEALRRAVHLDYARRYETSSEFIYDLSHPNPSFEKVVHVPLLESNPIRFWQLICLLLLLGNVLLVALLLARSAN